MRTTRIGITMGDPAGIGPEVIGAALRDLELSGERIIYGIDTLFEASSATVEHHATAREAIEAAAADLAAGTIDAVVTGPVS